MSEALEVRSDSEIVHLIATDPSEMKDAQAHLRKFLTAKIKETKVELHDVRLSRDIAVQNKWSSGTLHRQLERGEERLTFYEKALAAVEAGYTLIPNFPISTFAVRLKRENPREVVRESPYSKFSAMRSVPDEKPQALPAGEGRYVSPSQLVKTDSIVEKDQATGKDKTTYLAWPTQFSEVVFPLNIARPQIMDATAQAMVLKIFDEVGICPPVRQPDPLIIGRIAMKRVGGWSPAKELSFLIGWHLDLRSLCGHR